MLNFQCSLTTQVSVGPLNIYTPAPITDCTTLGSGILAALTLKYLNNCTAIVILSGLM